jgi:hypothetical protein
VCFVRNQSRLGNDFIQNLIVLNIYGKIHRRSIGTNIFASKFNGLRDNPGDDDMTAFMHLFTSKTFRQIH